jgi:hypothetical protein
MEVAYHEAVRGQAPRAELQERGRRHEGLGTARVLLHTYRDANQPEPKKAPRKPPDEESPRKQQARRRRSQDRPAGAPRAFPDPAVE